MAKIGYIVVIDYDYEDTVQVEDPSKVYLDPDEANRAAEEHGRRFGQSGSVWEVLLP
jgi:hypothetical protein